LEKIEDIIENILTQNNIEETKSFIDAEKENNKLEIIKNEGRIKDSLKEQYEKAVVEDSLYNENLREEAARISTNRVEDIQETIIIKHMPECKNIDTVSIT
jgi:isocitrate dehydrogenase kinase/phosphatase